MIHPSYTELIAEAINTNNEDDDTTMSINSRYSLGLAASKRATSGADCRSKTYGSWCSR